MSAVLMRSLGLAVLIVAAPALADDRTNWAGHYYLSGVMETGSELLLRADGSYDWFISYGAVDQFSKGQWAREGSEIILTSARPTRDKPDVTLDAQEPWNARTESLPQREVYDAAMARVLAACPFLSQDDLVASAPSTQLMEGTPGPAEAAAYDEALAHEAGARAAWESAAGQAVADTRMAQPAMAARKSWSDAETALRDAARLAGQAMPEVPAPKLPMACQTPTWPDPDQIDRAQWIGGHAVVVGDPVRGYRMSGVGIRFRYSDGQEADRVTTSGGLAWVPKRPGQTVQIVRMRWPENDRFTSLPDAPVTAVIPPDTIQPLRIDSDRLIPQPFTQLRLRISGRALIGFDGRGRYERPQRK